MSSPMQPKAPPRPGGWNRNAETATNLGGRVLDRATAKRIVICADGTWAKPPGSDGSERSASNVWLMYRMIAPQGRDGKPQLAYYHPGIGTGSFLDRMVGGLFGVGIERNILDCYRFIVEHYAPGDSIYLFGFSRGAYTVRSLAGLIRNCGILDRSSVPDIAATAREAMSHYRRRGDDTVPSAPKSVQFRSEHSHPDTRLTCIGVFDTVGALGIPVLLPPGIARLFYSGFHDVTLSSWVDRAFHAVSIHERRRSFLPTMWIQQPDARAAGQHLEQVWFTGVHTDVGGGYAAPERGLADFTLAWMVEQVSRYCGLEFDPPVPPAVSEASIGMHESLAWYYRVIGEKRRYIDGGLARNGVRDPSHMTAEAVHASVGERRKQWRQGDIPFINRRFDDATLGDFDRRVEASKKAKERPVSRPNDIKDPPVQ